MSNSRIGTVGVKRFAYVAALLMLAVGAQGVEGQSTWYWYVAFGDSSGERYLQAFALSGVPDPGTFTMDQPGESGSVVVRLEASTGSFLDPPPDPSSNTAPVAASMAEDAAVGAASEPEPETKTREFDQITVWAHDDEFNDHRNWTFHGAVATGQSLPNGDLVVTITYTSISSALEGN